MSDQNERRLAQHMGRCRHFNGTVNRACEAGVVYQDLCGGFGLFQRLPCIDRWASADAVECAQRSPFSMEEAVSYYAERDSMSKRIAMVRKDIVEELGGRPGSCLIGCVACGTGLVRGLVSVNGHVAARCSTQGCVWWME